MCVCVCHTIWFTLNILQINSSFIKETLNLLTFYNRKSIIFNLSIIFILIIYRIKV